MADWNDNTFMWIGGIGTAAVAVPVAIALAPPVIAGLGVIGGAAALTALGAGVIATTFAIGKHIDEAIEANNSHETIKEILDRTDYTDDKKIKDIERITEAKTNNIFLKLLNQLPGNEASKEVSKLYLGALFSEEATGEIETDKNTKILNGLRIVNKVDDFSRTRKDDFWGILINFKRENHILTYQEVGKKITEHSASIHPLLQDKKKNVYHYFDTLQEEIKKAALSNASDVVNANGVNSAFCITNPVEADREDKIWDHFYSFTSQEDLLSAVYQYKLKMGLNILESTRSESYKINELYILMTIIEQSDSLATFGDKTLSFASQFTTIDASPPTGDIAKDTPWPKALRVFAQAILKDATEGITDNDKLLALKSYLEELENPNEFVKEIQNLSDTHPKESIIKDDAQSFLEAFKTSDQHRYFTQVTLDSIKSIPAAGDGPATAPAGGGPDGAAAAAARPAGAAAAPPAAARPAGAAAAPAGGGPDGAGAAAAPPATVPVLGRGDAPDPVLARAAGAGVAAGGSP